MLEVRDLSAGYGPTDVLHDVSIDVPAGTVVALIGSNGAGKSTLLNVISGVISPHAGTVRFQGRDISGWRTDRIVGLGLVQVPEGRQVIGPMSVEDNLLLGGYRQPNPSGNLARQFARFPALASRRQQDAGSLSGGEQQQLAIGRALMARPQLLLLDEPSLGLAPKLVREVFAVIADLKASGATILLVEQNARKALAIADTAYVLDRGRIIRSGSAADLRDDPTIISAYLGSVG